jgi:membrane dipeptidase
MLIVDGHLDLGWNALQWNRDLRCSVNTIRVHEIEITGPGRALNTVALPEMRRGKVALAFATMLARSTGTPVPHIDYRSPAQAYSAAQGQRAYYRALAQQGYVRILTAWPEIERHMAEWASWDASGDGAHHAPPPLGLVLSMEGADPILEPEDLPAWWADGLRILGPVHYGPGRYGGGTGTEHGLTDRGRRLLAEMDRLGMILDLTHFSDRAFWEAVDRFEGLVLASHNNCRALVPHQRQFSDAQIEAIVARDGVIGAAFDTWMLQLGWIKGVSTPEAVTLDDVVDHIDHVCQVAGTSRHAAIGSDLDGGFGREQSPGDLDTIADLQRIAHRLRERGYDDADVAAIMHGNWLRLLEAQGRPA